MDLNNLLVIFSSSGHKIDALWEFYVTVHVALFGGLFLYHKMNVPQFFVTMISYIAFSIINLRAKYYEYKFYNAILEDIKLKSENLGTNVNHFFATYSLEDRITITFVVHAVSLIFVLYLGWNSIERKKAKESVEINK